MNDSSISVGIDIGGTRIKAVALQADGSRVDELIESSVDDVPGLVKLVREILNRIDQHEGSVGISSPGIAAADNRSISWMRGRMESLEGLRWCEALGRDVWVLNDAHAATLGESWQGAARGYRNALLLTLGTGVGGGVIINGELFQGSTGRAGHLGHITLDQFGIPDIVGMPGSLEDCIGNHNLFERSSGRFSSTAELLAAVRKGDSYATECWDQSVHGLAIGIASLVNCFDPEIVVLGGGISVCREALFNLLRQKLNEVEWRPTGSGVPIVEAKLGEFAGAVGAARFAALKNMEKQC
jgi:glucokinase